ncbi:flagellar hook protein FlgE [Frigidibacter sp. MR17.14]|uniref:flagellar hook protein FlgE n=1 Tax=Frigidibacter sp. MR17.14 TaxID=3126509 RepID=UPI0030130760
MGISNAMQTGVSGLYANSLAIEQVSSNIANSATTGYKRSFAQMVTTTAGTAVSSRGVSAVTTATVSQAGAITSTSSVTDLAISGNGFFVVSRNPNETVLSNYMLTRAGSFSVDDEGYLVNAGGYYLSGYAYNDDGTLPAFDANGFGSMETINLTNSTLDAKATTAISIAGNLPSQETGATSTGTSFISSTNFYTELGATDGLSLEWTPSTTANTWDIVFSLADGTQMGSVTVTFADSGTTAGTPLSYSNVTNLATAPASFGFDTATGTATLTIDNGTTPQVVDFTLGAPGSTTGVTQFAGDFAAQDFDVDGWPVSQLSRTEITEDGTVWGVYESGVRKALFMIPVATVTNPDALVEVSANAYRLSRDAGTLTIQQAGTAGAGTITSGALESSNVEIAQELTDLIRIQRAYSSNAKVITTADDMLAETTQIKR